MEHAVAVGAALDDLASFGFNARDRPLSIAQTDDLQRTRVCRLVMGGATRTAWAWRAHLLRLMPPLLSRP